MTFIGEVRRLGCDVSELKTMPVSPTLAYTCMHGFSDGLACGIVSANATIMSANVVVGSSSGTTVPTKKLFPNIVLLPHGVSWIREMPLVQNRRLEFLHTR